MKLQRPNRQPPERPSIELLEQEVQRVQYKRRYRSVLKSTLYALITVAAVAVLVATLWLPVMQTYGSSMAPTLNNGEIIFSVKTSTPERGDIIAFYYTNKILVKRVIGLPGEWVEIRDDGMVYINDHMLIEPYIAERSLGNADIEFPYQVPEGKNFVMGDHRATSADSRHPAVGCISGEQIVGRILFRVWPLDSFGPIG